MDSKWTDAGKVLNLKVDILALGLNNVGSSAPSNPEEGELWYDSTNDLLKSYDGAAWDTLLTIGDIHINTDITETIPVEPGRIGLEKRGLLSRIPDGSGAAVNFSVVSELLKSGTATGTTSDKLVDSGGGFSGVIEIDDIVCNRTDDTDARVTAVDSDTILSLDADIFVSGEDYEIFDKDSGNITMGYGSALIDYDFKTQVMTLTGAMVGQGALKTDTEEETSDLATATVVTYTFSSVGSYGFYPQIKAEASTSNLQVNIRGDDSADASTSYVTIIGMVHTSGANRNVYAQIRYVTASGEICWLFILQDKITRKYIRMHKSPDHPAICRHDVEAVHHPFYKAYDPQKHNMFVIPLTKSERAKVENMREWKNELPGLTFLECVKKYYDIDENPKDAVWPIIPVTIGLDRKRKPMKAKIPKRDYIKQAALIKKI